MKKKITVSALREFKFCNVSWCIARGLGDQTIEDLSEQEKKNLKKSIRISEKQIARGDTQHFFYDFQRAAGIIIYLIIAGVILWIILNSI